jgi:hypothetical protein
MPESRIPRYYAPKGHSTTIDLSGQPVEAYRALHHSGAGPGVLLLADAAGLDEGVCRPGPICSARKAIRSWR